MISPGNAVAVRLQGAQSSTARDYTIDVTHGYIGVEGGSGGGQQSIAVSGGQIGFGHRDTRSVANPTGIALISQTAAAVLVGGLGPLSLTGFSTDSAGEGPAKRPVSGSLELLLSLLNRLVERPR